MGSLQDICITPRVARCGAAVCRPAGSILTGLAVHLGVFEGECDVTRAQPRQQHIFLPSGLHEATFYAFQLDFGLSRVGIRDGFAGNDGELGRGNRTLRGATGVGISPRC